MADIEHMLKILPHLVLIEILNDSRVLELIPDLFKR